MIITLLIINKKRNKRVLENSPCLKAIRELNEKYKFESIATNLETKCFSVNNKRSFDTFNLSKKGVPYIIDNLFHFEEIVRKLTKNREDLKKYTEELKAIPFTSDEKIAKENKMSLKAFVKRENKFGSKLVQHPQTDFTLRFEWQYLSKAGRNFYKNHKDISFEKLVSVLKQINDAQNNAPRGKNKKDEKVYTNEDIEDIDEF